MTIEAICECPKCGRLHKHLQAGAPPLQMTSAPTVANPYSAQADDNRELAIRYCELAVEHGNCAIAEARLENRMLHLELDRSRMDHLITSGVLIATTACLVWSLLR